MLPFTIEAFHLKSRLAKFWNNFSFASSSEIQINQVLRVSKIVKPTFLKITQNIKISHEWSSITGRSSTYIFKFAAKYASAHFLESVLLRKKTCECHQPAPKSAEPIIKNKEQFPIFPLIINTSINLSIQNTFDDTCIQLCWKRLSNWATFQQNKYRKSVVF